MQSFKPYRTFPQQIWKKKNCHETLLGQDPSILYEGRQNALAPLENHMGLYASSIFTRKCRLKLVNIPLTKCQNIVVGLKKQQVKKTKLN